MENKEMNKRMELSLEELKQISTGVQPSDELLEDIALITTTLNGIKGGKNT